MIRKFGAAIATLALSAGIIAMSPSGPAVADTSWGRVIIADTSWG